MSSASKYMVLFLLSCGASVAVAAPILRVCADPNNLPYSNQEQQGFENKLANLIANDLGMQVAYTWYPQRERFFKKTLNSGVCDIVMSVPLGIDEASTTRPYYRSSYAFVSLRERNLHIVSLDDPRLRTLRIGIHVPGGGDSISPAVQALTSRGIVQNLYSYNIFSNLSANPAADLFDALGRNEIDVAIAWGPSAGYFARNSKTRLLVTPINADSVNPSLPLSFEIALGVREGQDAFKQQLDSELERRHTEIQQLLLSYGIPQLTLTQAAATGY
jgi:mxaJ protein